MTEWLDPLDLEYDHEYDSDNCPCMRFHDQPYCICGEVESS